MSCPECKDLYRIFERTRARYAEARTAAFFRISTRIAARKHVDLERAKSDLCEHQEACPWAIIAEQLRPYGIGHVATLPS